MPRPRDLSRRSLPARCDFRQLAQRMDHFLASEIGKTCALWKEVQWRAVTWRGFEHVPQNRDPRPARRPLAIIRRTEERHRAATKRGGEMGHAAIVADINDRRARVIPSTARGRDRWRRRKRTPVPHKPRRSISTGPTTTTALPPSRSRHQCTTWRKRASGQFFSREPLPGATINNGC